MLTLDDLAGIPPVSELIGQTIVVEKVVFDKNELGEIAYFKCDRGYFTTQSSVLISALKNARIFFEFNPGCGIRTVIREKVSKYNRKYYYFEAGDYVRI